MIGRTLRLLLRRTMYAGVKVGGVLRPFRLALAIALPLLGVIGVLTVALLWNRIAGPAPAFARADSIPPAPIVESYLEAQRNYNVDQMWEAFSPAFQAELSDKGISREKLKEQVQNQKQAGQSYVRPMYIGGVSIKGGGAVYFYLVDVRVGMAGANKSLPFVFTVDPQGKIAGVE